MTLRSGPKSPIPLRARRWRAALPILCFAVAAAALPAGAAGAVSVALEASPAVPASVGTMIRWTAFVTDSSTDLWFRFRVRRPGGDFRMIRDFGPLNVLDWTALDEGSYELEVTVRDRARQESAAAVSAFELVGRAGAAPAVAPTSHPLVFLFSSPGCDSGRARVRFESTSGLVQHTPFQPCVPGRSQNFYLAGLAPETTHTARLLVEDGRRSLAGPPVTFRTGEAVIEVPVPAVVQASPTSGREGILLQTPIFLPPIATDLNGLLLWYGPRDLFILTRPEQDGTFFGLVESRVDPSRDRFRKFDLVGMTILETNAARVSEQLVAMGKRPISGFHHEARTIGGGRIAVLASVEQILTDVQGPGPIDVIGDMIVVLDADLQVLWSWDAFDHLDPARRALLGQKCPTDPGCPPFYLAPLANDWTHSNSVAEAPDGSLLLSVRHQDWLLKIDYARGEGSGDVIWRLGNEGDFTIDSADPYPWFSHQHDASYVAGSRSAISMFDNGNRRKGLDPQARSRGQVLELDEENRTAHLVLNADLGVFSPALGSAQRLDDGRYQFGAGFVADALGLFGAAGYSLGVATSGDIFSSIKTLTPVYRSWRLDSMYGPAEAPERHVPVVVEPRN